jgi:eukaryotic-like serine/threonine-protein kinase
MNSLIRFLKSKLFLKNLLLAVVAVFIILFLLGRYLNAYTEHGSKIEVPDLTGFSLAEVEEALTPLELSFVVIDSVEFNPEFPRGSVVTQIPTAYSEVKRNREVYLSINPTGERKVALPNIIDKSRRQAVSYLETYGFRVGELRYLPDMARDVVIGMEIRGKRVQPGTVVAKNTRVDLILGDGLSDEKIDMPWIMGVSYAEVKTILQGYTLNLGAATFDETVEDTLSAVVYRQYPQARAHKVRLGSSIDVWLTADHTKVPVDSLPPVSNDPEIIDDAEDF